MPLVKMIERTPASISPFTATLGLRHQRCRTHSRTPELTFDGCLLASANQFDIVWVAVLFGRCDKAVDVAFDPFLFVSISSMYTRNFVLNSLLNAPEASSESGDRTLSKSLKLSNDDSAATATDCLVDDSSKKFVISRASAQLSAFQQVSVH